MLWLFQSNSHDLAQSSTNAFRIAIRLGIVIGVVGALCYAASIPPLLFFLVCCAIAFVGWGGMLLELAILALPLLGLLYVVQQFVLGFPDRSSWILGSNEHQPKKTRAKPNPFIGEQALTASPLRPTGDITLSDGSTHTAVTETNTFLDEQETVKIVAARDQTLIVRPINKNHS